MIHWATRAVTPSTCREVDASSQPHTLQQDAHICRTHVHQATRKSSSVAASSWCCSAERQKSKHTHNPACGSQMPLTEFHPLPLRLARFPQVHVHSAWALCILHLLLREVLDSSGQQRCHCAPPSSLLDSEFRKMRTHKTPPRLGTWCHVHTRCSAFRQSTVPLQNHHQQRSSPAVRTGRTGRRRANPLEADSSRSIVGVRLAIGSTAPAMTNALHSTTDIGAVVPELSSLASPRPLHNAQSVVDKGAARGAM